MAMRSRSRRPSSRSTAKHRRASAPSTRILRHAIAEGPVLLRHLDEADEHVLALQGEPFVQTIRHRFVERLLLLHGAARVERELDEHAILRALNSEVAF